MSKKIMNQETLDGKLRSVGKGSFVENFDCLQAYANKAITKEDAMRILTKGCEEGGALWRLGASKKIFRAGLQCEALRIVSQSSHGDLTKNGRDGNKVIAMAKSLMEKHCRP